MTYQRYRAISLLGSGVNGSLVVFALWGLGHWPLLTAIEVSVVTNALWQLAWEIIFRQVWGKYKNG